MHMLFSQKFEVAEFYMGIINDVNKKLHYKKVRDFISFLALKSNFLGFPITIDP